MMPGNMQGVSVKTDQQLKRQVMAELAWEPSINQNEIGVSVKDGVASLTGHLSSYVEKYAAERAAERVCGLKGLATGIDVILPGTCKRTDADIAFTVQRGIEWNPLIPQDAVNVMVENGWVTLSGIVEKQSQKIAAEKVVRPLVGVTGVSNQIVVQPVDAPAEMKSGIEAAFKRQEPRRLGGIAVAVDGREVTLSGKVPSLTERRRACRIASAAPGVVNVVDCMEIGTITPDATAREHNPTRTVMQ